MIVCLSGMRRSGHCEARTPSSDSARSSQEPCFGVYAIRPTAVTERDADAAGYFVKGFDFEHDVAPIFGPLLFQPIVRAVRAIASKLRLLRSRAISISISASSDCCSFLSWG